MNPSLRTSRAFRRFGWTILVLWIAACGYVQPGVIAPHPASDKHSVPTTIPTTIALSASMQQPDLAPALQTSASRSRLHMAQLPSNRPITSYVAYRMQSGDTLEHISTIGGSTPELIMSYNRLNVAPQPGRELLIPRLPGHTSELTKTQIMVTRGNTSKRWVALTFDCGGVNPNTDTLLDLLRDAKLKVTFFMLGDSIEQNPALLKRIQREGHELGNHSYHHPDFSKLTPQQMREELDNTERVIKNILGEQATTRPYVRLPYGAYNKEVIDTIVSHGYLPIHWSIDSYDSHGKRRSPAEIAEMVDSQLTEEQVPGAIVLMHCMDRSIEAVPQILENFQKRQIEVHTVTEVLEP